MVRESDSKELLFNDFIKEQRLISILVHTQVPGL